MPQRIVSLFTVPVGLVILLIAMFLKAFGVWDRPPKDGYADRW